MDELWKKEEEKKAPLHTLNYPMKNWESMLEGVELLGLVKRGSNLLGGNPHTKTMIIAEFARKMKEKGIQVHLVQHSLLTK